jgi:hypothetical protein
MPTSNLEHSPAVMHFLGALQPLRILDIGIGCGIYGFLIRQYCEIMHGRFKKSDWQLQIDGVEIYEAYRNPVWDYAYDKVHVVDIRKIVNNLGMYDVVLCIDVLEHFILEEARQLSRDLLSHTAVLIATTPSHKYTQGAWGGNEAERHLCFLKPRDFPNLIARKSAGVTTCYVCSADTSLIRLLKDAEGTCPLCMPEQWPNFKVRARRKLQRMYSNLKRL